MQYRFIRFPEGKLKAVTFSYDDGKKSDLRPADTLEKHNMKCTFNVPSAWKMCIRDRLRQDNAAGSMYNIVGFQTPVSYTHLIADPEAFAKRVEKVG